MPFTILAVGKQREPFYAQAMQEYLRRLSRYCKMTVKEIQDEKDPDLKSEALLQKAIEAVGDRILGALRDQDYVVALCIDAPQLSSEELSALVSGWRSRSVSVVFVIGGSNGLSEKVLKRADMKLSLSRMTLPHQLARVMLAEQIYRSFKIISGERYHK